jgi:hypothetical protein
MLDAENDFPFAPFVTPFGSALKLTNITDILHCMME